MEVLNRKKWLFKGVGFIYYISKNDEAELIRSFAPAINYKMLFMIAVCETYWYDHDTKRKIGIKWGGNELIVWKFALKFK